MSNKTKRLKKNSFVIPLFDHGTVEVFNNPKNMNKRMMELGYESCDMSEYAGLSTYTYHNNERVYLLGNFDGSSSNKAHEAFHVASAILDHSGVDYIKGNGNETFAYLIGFLVKKFEEVFPNRS